MAGFLLPADERSALGVSNISFKWQEQIHAVLYFRQATGVLDV
jgi:hypothetical protein